MSSLQSIQYISSWVSTARHEWSHLRNHNIYSYTKHRFSVRKNTSQKGVIIAWHSSQTSKHIQLSNTQVDELTEITNESRYKLLLQFTCSCCHAVQRTPCNTSEFWKLFTRCQHSLTKKAPSPLYREFWFGSSHDANTTQESFRKFGCVYVMASISPCELRSVW